MKKWLIAIIFGAILVLGACGGNDDGGSNNTVNNGGETTDVSGAEDIFKQNCASCHGGDLSGGEGPDLREIGSELSKDEIEDQIENGGGGMPPGLISGDELDTIVQWLSEKE